MSDSYVQKVKQDLLRVGISNYAIRRAEARHLAEVINQNETIHAAVFGRTPEGAAIMVATNKRVVYFRKTPLIATVDDISYEIVSGLTLGTAIGLFAAVTLHTRTGDYSIKYVNLKSATQFKKYIEESRLEGEPHHSQQTIASNETLSNVIPPGNIITKEAAAFLSCHELGVLSTLDRNGDISGAAVYYVFNSELQTLNIVTKNHTKKFKNIIANHSVAFTIYDESTLQTAQLQLYAELEPDAVIRQQVYNHITRQHQKGSKKFSAPVTALKEGSFTVIRLTPKAIDFNDFQKGSSKIHAN